MKLIIDNREPERFIKYIRKKCEEEGWDLEVAQLPVGDIVVPEKNICIERKAIDDFYASIGDGRLKVQIAQMRQYPIYAIIMVGASDSKTLYFSKHMREAAFLGAYRSVLMKHKCPIFNVANNGQFWLILKSIIKHADDAEEQIEARPIHSRHADVKIGMLSAIPGIGFEKAKAILEEYPTIKEVLKALDDGSFQVKGIGEKRKEAMKKAMGKP